MDLDKLGTSSCAKCCANVFELLDNRDLYNRPLLKCVECGTLSSKMPENVLKTFIKIWAETKAGK